jgi:hypothetical protein
MKKEILTPVHFIKLIPPFCFGEEKIFGELDPGTTPYPSSLGGSLGGVRWGQHKLKNSKSRNTTSIISEGYFSGQPVAFTTLNTFFR